VIGVPVGKAIYWPSEESGLPRLGTRSQPQENWLFRAICFT